MFLMTFTKLIPVILMKYLDFQSLLLVPLAKVKCKMHCGIAHCPRSTRLMHEGEK